VRWVKGGHVTTDYATRFVALALFPHVN